MKKIFTFILLSGILFLAHGKHIFGGEIEFITKQPGLYQINLIQYWDTRDEPPSTYINSEPTVTVYMFSNKNDSFIDAYVLVLDTTNSVGFTNMECARGELQIVKAFYTATFELEPSDFDHDEGYYIVWDRCCRNEVVKNIVEAGSQGNVFVADIPPLWKFGGPFINSSPIDHKPLRDYACIDQLYYADFSAFDPDGDSLSYRLATPLQSRSTDVPGQAALPPDPKPYDDLLWTTGYSVTNAIPGDPALRVYNDGQIRVNPLDTGIYVFSVIVEEWRFNVKIGQVRRDFQMLVVDGCDPPEAPKLDITIPDKPNFDPATDTLFYSLTEEKCFEFEVSNLEMGENITITTNLIEFDQTWDDFFLSNNVPVGDGTETLTFEFCAPGCPPKLGAFAVDFIASDDACPVAQVDTLRLVMHLQAPPNEIPTITGLAEEYTLTEFGKIQVPFEVTDADMDSLQLFTFLNDGLNPRQYGINPEILSSEPGKIEGVLNWESNCLRYDYSNYQAFDLGMRPEDLDSCLVLNEIYKNIDLNLDLPINRAPELSINSSQEITVTESDVVEFQLNGVDQDQDTIIVKLEGLGFDPSKYGFEFKKDTVVGDFTKQIKWEVNCFDFWDVNLEKFEFRFILEDIDQCRDNKSDTLYYTVNLDLEENYAPQFLGDLTEIAHNVNEPLEIEISAIDDNLDNLVTIEWLNPARIPRSESLVFEAATGKASVTSLLTWEPECILLDYGEDYTYYDLRFLAYDDGCPEQKKDTLSIRVALSDHLDAHANFKPPNVFTPDGDGLNDIFTLTNLDLPSYNLPPDRCDNAFVSIVITNRNGKVVFQSDSREFIWDGGDLPKGVYYYYIQYELNDYKGFVHLIK